MPKQQAEPSLCFLIKEQKEATFRVSAWYGMISLDLFLQVQWLDLMISLKSQETPE